MCPNGVINTGTPRTGTDLIFVDPSGNTIETVPGPPSTTTIFAPPKSPTITIELAPPNQPLADQPFLYLPATCNCDVPKMSELGACSRKVKLATINPGANPMLWHGGSDITFCACESGTRQGLTICGQFACPNGPQLETPTPCPSSACAWPTNTKLGRCKPRSAKISTGGGLDDFQTYSFWMCDYQGSTQVPMLTGCDGAHVCPNRLDLVTDTDAYNAAVDVSCTEQLPSHSFWDSCVYTRDPPARGVVSELIEDIKHTCMCNIADAKSVTNPYHPLTAKCGPTFLCHNSAPLSRRAALFEPLATPILPPPSLSTAVTPLIPITTEATPGSLPTVLPGPTSVSTTG
jgi:hypothetical protein